MIVKAFDTTPEQLAKFIGCHIDTVKRFLDRAEFAHIQKTYVKSEGRGNGRKVIYHNVFHSDIALLKKFYRPTNKRRVKYAD